MVHEIIRGKTRQRVQSSIRSDERQLGVSDFEIFATLVGPEEMHFSGGVVAVSELRVLIAQDNGTYTSIIHADIRRVHTQPRFVRPSVLTLDAGALGVVSLVGKRAVCSLAPMVQERLGRPISDQPLARLLPSIAKGPLRCSECNVNQQDGWDPTPAYCHRCLCRFEWTAERVKRTTEYREWAASGDPAPPSSLWGWIKTEDGRYRGP